MFFFLGQREDPLLSVSFALEIEGIQHAEFTEFAGLEAEVEVLSYEEGGCNDYVHKLPVRTKYSNITLKRGVTSTGDLWEWFMSVVQGRPARRNLSVVMYSADHSEVKRWNFTRAFPVKWVGPTLKTGESAVAIESLEIAHESMSVS